MGYLGTQNKSTMGQKHFLPFRKAFQRAGGGGSLGWLNQDGGSLGDHSGLMASLAPARHLANFVVCWFLQLFLVTNRREITKYCKARNAILCTGVDSNKWDDIEDKCIQIIQVQHFLVPITIFNSDR